jgi:hypothetical protein
MLLDEAVNDQRLYKALHKVLVKNYSTLIKKHLTNSEYARRSFSIP